MSETRIWYQSFVDPVEQANYIQQLQQALNRFADPGFEFVVQGLSPPDTGLHALTEFRCAAQTIKNALKAQEEEYDAFVIGHFQEPGLSEIKACLSIPVIGLGEANMLMACNYGEKIGLITINPIFIPWHEKQIRTMGLSQRVVSVRAVNFQVDEFDAAFADEAIYQRIKDQFVDEMRSLADSQVEVVIPAGGLPMLLLAREQSLVIDEMVVLNGIALVAKYTEMMLKLHRLTGLGVSRKAQFKSPSAEVLEEFSGLWAPAY
ncbi:MAG TPA: aspartate/glutamate racemase family protein [Xanthomonadales bacterium]|nr:aspartate/glutamate racemase family protein [Xanthomonadales bacterium]